MSTATADYGTRVQISQGGNELILGSGSSFSVDAGVTINGALATETINIPLDSFRVISSTAGEMFSSGNLGYLSSGSLPKLDLVSTVDRTPRLDWTSASIVGVQTYSILPPSNYTTATGLTINVLGGKGSSAGSTAVNIDVRFWPGAGGAECGTVTANFADGARSLYSVAISSANLVTAANGGSWTLALVPSTHDADALHVYGVSLSYARQGS